MGIGFVIQSIFLGVGLAMDATCVAMTNGLNYPSLKKKHALLIAFMYGFFQALMPLIGYLLGVSFNEILSKLQQEGINLLEARNAIEEHYLSYQESINESYDTYIGQIEEINGALEHQKSLVELIYGDKAIKQLDNYYSVSISNLEMITAAQKNRYALDTEDYLNALKTNDESLIKATQEQYMQSADAYFKSLNDLAKMRQEEYLNSIDVLLKNFDEKTQNVKNLL